MWPADTQPIMESSVSQFSELGAIYFAQACRLLILKINFAFDVNKS